jgi:hypothetical protein
MQELYENLAENISTNPQMFALLEFCRRVDHVTIAGFGDGLSTLVAITAKPDTIVVYDHSPQDIDQFYDIAMANGVKLTFNQSNILEQESIDATALLYVDSFAEGNFVHTLLHKAEPVVSRYIIVNKTFTNGHDPDPTIKLNNGAQPVGIVFGINNFIQTNDAWHISENLYWEPGMTALYRRKELLDHDASY